MIGRAEVRDIDRRGCVGVTAGGADSSGWLAAAGEHRLSGMGESHSPAEGYPELR